MAQVNAAAEGYERAKRPSWRPSFLRSNSAKSGGEWEVVVITWLTGAASESSDGYGSPSPPRSPVGSPSPLVGVGAYRKAVASPGSDHMASPWHLRKYEIYQPAARAPARYYNWHLLSAAARDRLKRELQSGRCAGSVRSSLRPSVHLAGSAGVGLETITASPASTAAPLGSPAPDPLSSGPAANHRLSTWLKRPPASPHTYTQPLPTDATDLMDGTDPFGSMWHHSSPYDAGELVVGRRARDSGTLDHGTRSGMLSPTRKGPSPLSQSAVDPEPPLPEPPGSPDLLSAARRTRKLSKRRSTSASRGLSSLFARKPSEEDGPLRGRSRPPLSPSSQSLAQTQGIAFPSHDGEKRPRRKLSKRGRSGSMSSGVSVDSARSVETPIHTQFSREDRNVEIVEQKDPPPPPTRSPYPPSATANKQRERKISAASITSIISRITSRGDKGDDKHPRAASAQDTVRKKAPHLMLNHVGKQKGERGGVFGRLARKLSLIRRRSVDAFGGDVEVVSRPSFQVERPRPPQLNRRATLDLTPYRASCARPRESQAPLADLFAPIDPQLRSSRLIHAPLSPPPRIPDSVLPGDRGSWASLHRHVSTNRSQAEDRAPPPIDTEELLPPPPIGGARNSTDGKHPDSPHSIPKWGIANGDSHKGPALIMNGSPTDDSPLTLPKTVLTIANPDDSEPEEVPLDGLVALRAQLEASVAEQGRNRALPRMSPHLPMVPVYDALADSAGVRPLVIKKVPSRSPSRSPSPAKPLDGRESPLKRAGRDSPVKRAGRRRDMSLVKPVRRTEPLKDHSAYEYADAGMSIHMGSTTSVDAIKGDDDAEFGKHVEDNGRARMRSRASMDSIGKMHVITPKTSLQKIRVRVVSNPPPIEITKESSPVKQDPPALPAAEDAPEAQPRAESVPMSRSRSKSRPRSGYTGVDSRYSSCGTATSDSTDDPHQVPASPAGPRYRMSIEPGASTSRIHSKSADVVKPTTTTTPYMTPTDEHAPLHPFTDKPVEYHAMMPMPMPMPPISVMRMEMEAASPVLSPAWPRLEGLEPKPKALVDSKGAWIEDSSHSLVGDEFSVSREKLVAQGEFKRVNGQLGREVGEGERERERERRRREEREREVERARRERVERERAERERVERERVERERVERERAERERVERERADRERVERERADRERQERERLRQEAQAERLRAEARLEQARLERERAEQERAERLERERLERERLERERLERERLERERAERERLERLERQRQREEQERLERIARERDRERVEKERLEQERRELERERLERERAERARAEWQRMERERLERERLMEEDNRRPPPPLLHHSTGGSRRSNRHDADGEREVHITTMKDSRKASKRRTPEQSRSTSPTSTAPPAPPPKDERSLKPRQRSQTDASFVVPITSPVPPPVQQPIEVLAGVPVLPQGTHVEVVQSFHARPTSESTLDAPSLRARDAWERERLDKGQSVLGPGGQRAVIPDVGSPRPAPDPRQRQSSSKSRSQTTSALHEPFVLSPPQVHTSAAAAAAAASALGDYSPLHSVFPKPSFPSRSHNPLPKPPTIDGPYPLHRPPGPAYSNPNRQRSAVQGRPAAPRNPLPEPPRVSSYPLHHNVSPPRGLPPGAVR
ncbi:S-formylglutathione hydrolase [Ceratobasidium theobromae]|uniref:S-formylglutathione hydrolase n=1 Tax=Ceratobasidium theobromae TaxID=1582974 RepID=A0A5N5QDW5_9AGAM|nr:S-formylglutathione hydrolase [Ceratobasidium theobromae]